MCLFFCLKIFILKLGKNKVMWDSLNQVDPDGNN